VAGNTVSGEPSEEMTAVQPVFSVRRMSPEEQAPRPGDLDEEVPTRGRSFRIAATLSLLAGGALIVAIWSAKMPDGGAAGIRASTDVARAPSRSGEPATSSTPSSHGALAPANAEVPRAAETTARSSAHHETARTRPAPAHNRRDVRSKDTLPAAPGSSSDEAVVGDADSTLPPSIE
jgi:hypothetical protein